MEPLILTDKSVLPTDALIFSIIGENSQHWQNLIHLIHKKYPDSQSQWNYYNDGKSWLFKMIRKKKTLFWIGVLKDTFQITFYFGDKAESVIVKSDIPDELKDMYLNGKRYGKIRAVTIKVSQTKDIENAIKLADIKVKV